MEVGLLRKKSNFCHIFKCETISSTYPWEWVGDSFRCIQVVWLVWSVSSVKKLLLHLVDLNTNFAGNCAFPIKMEDAEEDDWRDFW